MAYSCFSSGLGAVHSTFWESGMVDVGLGLEKEEKTEGGA